MNKQAIVDALYNEIHDAELTIDDLEERIASIRDDLNYVEGRRCLACSLLRQVEE